jgi:hypothetical protein
MVNNKAQIKALNRIAIIQELIEKSKNCSLFWQQSSLNQFKTQFSNYKFFVTKNLNDYFVLDVLQDDQLYVTYNSIINPNVEELYKIIELLVSESTVNKYRRVNEFIGRKGSCRQGEIGSSNKLYPINLQGFGLKASGTVAPEIFRRRLAYFTPTGIEFDTTYPWTGNYENIKVNDVFSNHDGDATYIRQSVAGLLPTYWGYLDVKFDLSSVPKKPFFTIVARVVARRETEGDVFLNINMLVNDTNVWQQTILLSESYILWSSNETWLDNSISSIEDFKLRLTTYTNSGNLIPRAVRVTGVDLAIYGYDVI